MCLNILKHRNIAKMFIKYNRIHKQVSFKKNCKKILVIIKYSKLLISYFLLETILNTHLLVFVYYFCGVL